MRMSIVCLLVLAAHCPLAADEIVVGKDGSSLTATSFIFEGSAVGGRADFEFNTGGVIDGPPTTAGTASDWGEWFITTLRNDTEKPLLLLEIGFPCSGSSSETYGWLVWTDVGGMNSPHLGARSAQFFGSFSPAAAADQVPPRTYTYVDISDRGIVVPVGACYCFGYDVTGLGGQVEFSGVETWSWYSGYWDLDAGWGRTALLQIRADFAPTATFGSSWSGIKSLY